MERNHDVLDQSHHEIRRKVRAELSLVQFWFKEAISPGLLPYSLIRNHILNRFLKLSDQDLTGASHNHLKSSFSHAIFRIPEKAFGKHDVR